MATLQKFKLLATKCAAVAGSPTRSPVVNLRRRRRKTLRMLLSLRHSSPQSPIHSNNTNNNTNNASVSLKLKDFLLSSPSESPERQKERVPRGRVSRPFNLRQRLMRKAFRPILLAIPE